MSNEEIVARIQVGETGLYEALWDQVVDLVKWKANQVMTALGGRGGVEFDDLVNSGYPALVAAVGNYQPDKGAFSTWFMLHLKTAFAEATGYRTPRQSKEPLRNAVSLDAELEDGGVFGDLVPDPKGEAGLRSVEQSIYQQQLHEVMEKALSHIPATQSEVLRLRYYDGLTIEQIANAKRKRTAEAARKIVNKGLRSLRRSTILQKFCDFNFYAGTGLGAFNCTGASVQEMYLIHEEERKERESRRLREICENEVRSMMEGIAQEAEMRVANMTPEEKERLMKLYGLA